MRTTEGRSPISVADLEKLEEALKPETPAIGPATCGDPLDCLVATLLSQATSDVNSHRAFKNLKEHFPSWEKILEASLEDVAAAIRPGGLSQVKAQRIREIVRDIADHRGRPELDFLRSMPTEEARQYLMRFKGVGPKTAACVLLFALGRVAFPVDTHVCRVMKRLGLLERSLSPEQVERIVEQAIAGHPRAAAIALNLHLGLIEHGRSVCRARKPRCEICFAREWCPGRENSRPAGGERP